MNDDELRQRQLARLRGEVIDPPIVGSALEFAPDPELDADYASYCKSQRDWEREPQPREVWETKHKEAMQRLNVQPENPLEETPFVVGSHRDEYGDLHALPAPKWPNPGEPKTLDISHAYSAEEQLVNDANRALTDCVRWLAMRIRNPDEWDNPYSGTPSQLYEVSWKFLTGVLRGRNIETPSDMQMMTWSREYNQEHYTRKRSHAIPRNEA